MGYITRDSRERVRWIEMVRDATRAGGLSSSLMGPRKKKIRSVYDDGDNYEAGRGDYYNGDVNKEDDDDDDDVECVLKEKEFELNVQ